jgi:hypothetical protein
MTFNHFSIDELILEKTWKRLSQIQNISETINWWRFNWEECNEEEEKKLM